MELPMAVVVRPVGGLPVSELFNSYTLLDDIIKLLVGCSNYGDYLF